MQPYRVKTVSQYHKFRGLPGPTHPLISVVRIEQIAQLRDDEPDHIVQDFYSVALKKNVNGTLRYGQQNYEFDEGKLFFIAPNQVYSLQAKKDLTHSGWLLLIHPDFFWSTSLTKKMRQYEYFGTRCTKLFICQQRRKKPLSEFCKAFRENAIPILITSVSPLLFPKSNYC